MRDFAAPHEEKQLVILTEGYAESAADNWK